MIDIWHIICFTCALYPIHATNAARKLTWGFYAVHFSVFKTRRIYAGDSTGGEAGAPWGLRLDYCTLLSKRLRPYTYVSLTRLKRNIPFNRHMQYVFISTWLYFLFFFVFNFTLLVPDCIILCIHVSCTTMAVWVTILVLLHLLNFIWFDLIFSNERSLFPPGGSTWLRLIFTHHQWRTTQHKGQERGEGMKRQEVRKWWGKREWKQEGR